jgi:hypothetical protein
MADYTVEWNCLYDDCDSPEDAAIKAWDDLRREDSIASVFEVTTEHDMTYRVDLHEHDISTGVWTPAPAAIADLAQWMNDENWDFSEIVEMIRRPHKYAAEYSKMVIDRAYDAVSTEPEEIDEDYNVSDVKVRFVPPDVPTGGFVAEWFVSEETAHEIGEQLAGRTAASDFKWVRDDDQFTPKWMREWMGPYHIETLPEGHGFEADAGDDWCAKCGADISWHKSVVD